jgi:LuxR family maltose regulon positive regulatory protein
MVPGWIKENFISYRHAYSIENFGNQVKARYHYLTKNYLPLLTYIDEMKQRESVVLGRVEMLALEACIHYRTKSKKPAFKALLAAYETAAPNNIIMPFIELGKDMRTLVGAMNKEADCGIPTEWLEDIRSKSASYAKNQSHLIFIKKSAGEIGGNDLSPREYEILCGLYHGKSRSEIADDHKISLNRVNAAVSNIFLKFGVSKISDVIRIAAEKKMV